MEKHRGIIRRVDSLGRVVIPKEIRAAMHVNFGDLIEFDLNENNLVVMKKFHTLSDLKSVLASIVGLASTCGTVVYVFDTENLIFANNNFCFQLVTNDFKSILHTRKDCFLNKIEIVENLVVEKAEFFPIVCNGDVFGGLVTLGENSKEVGKNLKNFFVSFLS